MERNIKIDETILKSLVEEIVNKVLFDTLPKQDASGNMYHTMLTGKPYLIKEGLIYSYPTDNVIYALKNLFNLSDESNKQERNKILYNLDKNNKHKIYNGIIFLNKYSQNNTERIELIVNMNDFNQNDFDKYLLKYGWYCGISEKLDYYDNLIRFIYEKKFDVNVTDVVKQNRFIYHICPDIYLSKINLNGLKPKFSSWNIYSNPERVYFFLKELKHNDFLRWVVDFYQNKNFPYDKTNGFVLLRIDISETSNNPEFYFDPRMNDAVYTMDNITPKAIEVIDYISKDSIFD